MAWRTLMASRWRNLFRRTRVERELDDEVRAYVQMLADEKTRAGLDPAEARRAALLELGGVEQVKEQVRDVKVGARLLHLLPTLWQDLRYAARMLVAQPAFSGAAVLALALGIGATTAIFSVVDGVLFRPLPFPQEDRLASVFVRFTPQNMARGPLSMADYLDLRAGTRAFDEMGAYMSGRFDLTGTEAPETIAGLWVSSGFFSVLGVPPLLGRTFLPGEDAPNQARLLVIGESYWRRRLGADPAVVGRAVTLNGVSRTIIGVMPARFTFPDAQIDVWANLSMSPPTRRGPFMLRTVGRLRPGATLAQAQAETDIVAPRIEREHPTVYRRLSMPVVPLRDVLVGDAKPALLVMFAAVGVVLLIATVNVASLLLARATARGREIAIRLSLGASRGRLVRQLLTESVLLALIGGALGAALAFGGLEALRTTNAGSIPRIEAVRVDLRVLLFTGAVALVTGVLFGLAPALQSLRPGLTRSLKDGGDRAATAGVSRRRAHAALVIAEIALSLVLLIGAGLLLRSFFLLQQVDAGFQAPPGQVLTMRLSPSRGRFQTTAGNAVSLDNRAVAAYYEQLLARVRQVPGVGPVALAEALPPDRTTWTDSFVIEGQSVAEAQNNPSVAIPTVSPDYFRALGIPLLKGRTFDARDTTTSTPVTVISEQMARRYFVGRDPIGARIKLSGPGLPDNPKLDVIGVVGDVKYAGLGSDDNPVYYRAYAQAATLGLHLVVRAAQSGSGSGASLALTLRREMQAFDKDLVIAQAGTMEAVLADSIAGPRFRMLLLGVFAGVALLLAATGIYGVMAYSVAQRTHELGLRLALGAARGDVLRLVLGQAAWLALAGIVLGLTGALFVTQWMRTLLFGVEATDPLTFAGVAAGLIGVALLATVVPARRAMGVDPMVALRQD